ncbi:Flagellar hook protein FlgE [hydrothermal vent metagenome]|uniref:Flagellar hook protein FlgE n=1 Tax=hydrothermal vent metagenome TaxID=652676 RepID=A0A3B0R7C5_9ZZZZ
MGIGNVMRTGVSGMSAQGNKLSAVADNIANADTIGYKRAEIEFSSRIPQSITGEYVSGGVDSNIRHAISQQGSLQFTDSVTDLAIRGSGFFVVEDGSGSPFLTRAGSFVQDSDGYLVNAGGFYLMGFDVSNGAVPAPTANGFAGLDRVRVTDSSLTARASDVGALQVNLESNANTVAAAQLPSTNGVLSEFTSKTSLVSYDNLGNQELVDVYYSKTAANTWEVAVYAQSDAAANGGFPYSSAALLTDTLQFDPSTGDLTGGSPSNLVFNIPNGQALTLDISNTSQLAADFTVLNAQVNGNAASGFELLEIDENGTMFSSFSDSSRVETFIIPLASVPSPDNLQVLPGDIFQSGKGSGEVLMGFANSGGRGSIIAGAKEQSTVDLATELTSMIEAQRGYQANSKVFQAGSELMDVVVNLKR